MNTAKKILANSFRNYYTCSFKEWVYFFFTMQNNEEFISKHDKKTKLDNDIIMTNDEHINVFLFIIERNILWKIRL